MGGPKSLKAYQVSERLTLDYISDYIKCCCTLTGYLIGVALQRAWGGGEHLLHITALGALLDFPSMLLNAWGNQAKHPDKSRLCLGSLHLFK